MFQKEGWRRFAQEEDKLLAQQLETVNQEVQDAVELRSIQTTMQQQEAQRRVVEKRGELEGLLQETVTKVLDDMGLLVNKLSKPGVPSLG